MLQLDLNGKTPPPGWKALDYNSSYRTTGYWCNDCREAVMPMWVVDGEGVKWEVCTECFLDAVGLENMTEAEIRGTPIGYVHSVCGTQLITRVLQDDPVPYCNECGVFVAEKNMRLLAEGGPVEEVVESRPSLLLAAKTSAVKGLLESGLTEDEELDVIAEGWRGCL